MERSRPDVGIRVFLITVLLGVIFLFVVCSGLSVPERKLLMPLFRGVNEQSRASDDASAPLYQFMKKEWETMIREALKKDEDLLIRGKLFKLYRPTFTCPYKVAQWGSVGLNGHKWVCGAQELYSRTNRTCVVYSFGVDGDSSFEADILNVTDCSVYAYDHTVEGISKPLRRDNPRVKFGKYGLADFNSRGNNITFKTVKDAMDMNGHKWIDILKLDVEGAEFDGMTMLMNDFDELPIGQLQVELHVWVNKSQVYGKIVPWLNRLEEMGLRTFWAAPNGGDPGRTQIDCGKSNHSMAQYEYSFININAKPFRNSSFTFEKLLMGAAISTDLHYPVN